MRLGCTSAAQQSPPCLFTHLHHFTTAQSSKAQLAAGGTSVNKPSLCFPARLEELHPSHRPRKTSCRATVHLPAPDLTEKKPRLAIFVSGGGSNFRAIHAGILDGRINAEVAVVISDIPGCGGWDYAAAHGIPTEVYPASAKATAAGSQPLTTQELVTAVKELYAVDYVLLAGYLKLIPEELVREFKQKMLNIHPALLPAFGGKGFYGSKVHRAVIASGARFSGPTIHFVDEGYDTGPIVAQAVVPVSPTDTPKQLAAKVLVEEHRLYPHVVAALVGGRINWRADGIPVIWSAH